MQAHSGMPASHCLASSHSSGIHGPDRSGMWTAQSWPKAKSGQSWWPKVRPKLAQSRPKVRPKLGESWAKVEPELGQSQANVGPQAKVNLKSGQSWPEVGPKLEQSRPKVGPKPAQCQAKVSPGRQRCTDPHSIGMGCKPCLRSCIQP